MKNPAILRRVAIELGFDQAWAEKLARERPGDLERWGELGHVPPDEDPRATITPT